MAHGVGRVVGALDSGTGVAGSMLDKVVFHEAYTSLIYTAKWDCL